MVGGAKDIWAYGDALWIKRHVGEPVQQLFTWYEVVTAPDSETTWPLTQRQLGATTPLAIRT
jgi:hypothetical protein